MSAYNNGKKFLVDSNIFLRVIVRDNEKTWKDCFTFLKLVENAKVEAYVPTIVPREVGYVLKSFYGYEKHVIVEALKSMSALPNLRILDDLSFHVAIELFEDYNVKFIDCLLVSSKRIQSGNAAIVSYDRDFDKLGVRRLEPKDFLLSGNYPTRSYTKKDLNEFMTLEKKETNELRKKGLL